MNCQAHLNGHVSVSGSVLIGSVHRAVGELSDTLECLSVCLSVSGSVPIGSVH